MSRTERVWQMPWKQWLKIITYLKSELTHPTQILTSENGDLLLVARRLIYLRDTQFKNTMIVLKHNIYLCLSKNEICFMPKWNVGQPWSLKTAIVSTLIPENNIQDEKIYKNWGTNVGQGAGICPFDTQIHQHVSSIRICSLIFNLQQIFIDLSSQ